MRLFAGLLSQEHQWVGQAPWTDDACACGHVGERDEHLIHVGLEIGVALARVRLGRQVLNTPSAIRPDRAMLTPHGCCQSGDGPLATFDARACLESFINGLLVEAEWRDQTCGETLLLGGPDVSAGVLMCRTATIVVTNHRHRFTVAVSRSTSNRSVQFFPELEFREARTVVCRALVS